MLALSVLATTAGAVYASPDTPDPIIHVVQSGDNLGKISEQHGISIGALALANGLSSSIIHVGQNIIIPESDWPVNPESNSRDPHQPITYVVRSGDYLGRVALEYGTTVEAIMSASTLASPLIITDQFLTIPAIQVLESRDVAAAVVEVTTVAIVDDRTVVGEHVSEANLPDAVVEVIAAELVDDSVEVSDDINEVNSPNAVAEVKAVEIVDDSAVVGEDISEVEARMRQELHNANYPYAFTESSDEITRVYLDTVSGATAAAAELVVTYWTHVTEKRYEAAWEMLTDGFKARVHDDDFEEYAQSYRDMALCSANAENVNVASQSGSQGQAVVNADVTYRSDADCIPLEFNMTFTLLRLPASSEWAIEKVAVVPSGEVEARKPGFGSGESKWIDVDIGAQRVYAMVGDRRAREFVASTGITRYPTVTGQFQVYVQYRKDDMRGVDLGVPWYLPDVPYVMYFFSGYAIHGTYWHDNFGTPMSHGCVNLSIEDAEWLYNFSQVGTVVNVHH